MWWGSALVTVGDTDTRDVSIELQRGAVVSGRVVLPQSAARAQRPPRPVSVILESVDGQSADGTMAGDHEQGALGRTVSESDLTFRTRPLPPGRMPGMW